AKPPQRPRTRTTLCALRTSAFSASLCEPLPPRPPREREECRRARRNALRALTSTALAVPARRALHAALHVDQLGGALGAGAGERLARIVRQEVEPHLGLRLRLGAGRHGARRQRLHDRQL